jgi:hypothetical protein
MSRFLASRALALAEFCFEVAVGVAEVARRVRWRP